MRVHAAPFVAHHERAAFFELHLLEADGPLRDLNTVQQRAVLRKHNALDLELYEFARERSRQITGAVQQAQPGAFTEPHYAETSKSAECSSAYRTWATREERRKQKQLEALDEKTAADRHAFQQLRREISERTGQAFDHARELEASKSLARKYRDELLAAGKDPSELASVEAGSEQLPPGGEEVGAKAEQLTGSKVQSPRADHLQVKLLTAEEARRTAVCEASEAVERMEALELERENSSSRQSVPIEWSPSVASGSAGSRSSTTQMSASGLARAPSLSRPGSTFSRAIATCSPSATLT